MRRSRRNGQCVREASTCERSRSAARISSPSTDAFATSCPFGVVIAQASTDKEETLVAEIDPKRIEEVRRNWPFLRDRRIDAYGGIERRFVDK